MPETTERIDTRVEKTTDLSVQEEQVKSLRNRIADLQRETEQQVTKVEQSFAQLRRDRDEGIAELRRQHDACLDHGDRAGAESCLDQIKAKRHEVKKVASAILALEGDVGDLKERKRLLYTEATGLYCQTVESFKLAEKQMKESAAIIATAGNHHPLQELETITEKATRDAEKFLAD